MKAPDATKHRPEALYARAVMSELQSLGRTIKSVCAQVGVPERTMRDYMNPDCPTDWDYRTQYCVEQVLEVERWYSEYRASEAVEDLSGEEGRRVA